MSPGIQLLPLLFPVVCGKKRGSMVEFLCEVVNTGEHQMGYARALIVSLSSPSRLPLVSLSPPSRLPLASCTLSTLGVFDSKIAEGGLCALWLYLLAMVLFVVRTLTPNRDLVLRRRVQWNTGEEASSPCRVTFVRVA